MTEGTKPRLVYAPIPLRALPDERLTGLHLRALAAVAAHDRLGKNRQGCWASMATLATLCGCNVKNLITAITDLVAWGYLSREPRPDDKRKRVLRVIYTDDDRRLISKKVAEGQQTETVAQEQPTGTEIGCLNDRDRLPAIGDSAQKTADPAAQENEYIRENPEKDPVKTASPCGDAARQGSEKSVGKSLALLERRLRQAPENLDVYEARRYLTDLHIDLDRQDPNYGRIYRLLDEVAVVIEDLELGRVDDDF